MLTVVAAALLSLSSPAPQAPSLALSIAPMKTAESIVCSLNVVDWDVSKCLRLLSEQTHVNMVVLSNPSAKLTVRLEKVPLPEMVRHLCAITGLSVLKIGDAYVFATEEALKKGYPVEFERDHPTPPPALPLPKGERATQIYRTSFVNADALVSTLRELFPKDDVNIATGPEVSNPFLTIVKANDSGDSMSSTTQTAAGESKTQYGDSVKKDTMNKGRTLVVTGDATVVQRVLDIAKQVDQPRKQVVIEVSVLETSDDLAREMGLSWTFGDVSVIETSNKSNGDSQPMNLGNFNRSSITGTGTIKANELRTKSRVLASPTVSVLDGESAFVLIGSRIKYSVLKQPATQYSPAIYDIQEDRIGIYLQVAAQVASDGTIAMNLYPQVSTVSGYLTVNGSNLPQIATREAKTIMRMTSGQTIVMGGLIQDKDVNTLEKVPLLGDIPVLGEFFKRRQKSKVASQLVITITPHIVDVKPAP